MTTTTVGGGKASRVCERKAISSEAADRGGDRHRRPRVNIIYFIFFFHSAGLILLLDGAGY